MSSSFSIAYVQHNVIRGYEKIKPSKHTHTQRFSYCKKRVYNTITFNQIQNVIKYFLCIKLHIVFIISGISKG